MWNKAQAAWEQGLRRKAVPSGRSAGGGVKAVALEQGVEAMTRLQRELTKRFFLAGTEKVLITFSAGVAQLAADETGPDAIKRADQAMYLAKRSGKNRVLGA